jgi:putative oxidoreductase
MRPVWLHRYARWALGAAFLSAVASRLGLWGGGSFDKFLAYTAEVLSFLPHALVAPCAYAATALELSFGVALVAGLWVHEVALASGVLLAIFGTSMAISQGIKSPLDYSVFSGSAAALLLANARRAISPS